MKPCQPFLLLGALATFAFAVPALPAAAMDLASVDCSQVPAMMMKPHTDDAMAMPAMPDNATTDQAFDGMSHMMMKHAAMMAGMELKCGKDAKSRAAAVKLLQQLNDDGVTEAMDILHTYNH
jgi:hypothetical protein